MPRRLAKVTSSCAAARTCATEPGRAVDVVGPQRLDRVDDGERRALGLERGQDVAEVGLGRELQRRVAEAEAGGAQADLRGRPPRPRCRPPAVPRAAKAAAACSSSVDLPMPGSPPTRMADAGTRPPPSTRSSSAMPGEGARQRRLGRSARSPRAIRRPRPAPRVRPAGPSARPASSTMRVPGAAGVAAAGPFRVGGAAGGADEGGAAGAHARDPVAAGGRVALDRPRALTQTIASALTCSTTESGNRATDIKQHPRAFIAV